MRLSELGEREIVDLSDGRRLGLLGQSDLGLDEETGAIVEILLPLPGRLFERRTRLAIPWQAVRRVGPELVIVETEGRTEAKGRRAKGRS